MEASFISDMLKNIRYKGNCQEKNECEFARLLPKTRKGNIQGYLYRLAKAYRGIVGLVNIVLIPKYRRKVMTELMLRDVSAMTSRICALWKGKERERTGNCSHPIIDIFPTDQSRGFTALPR
jgi:hypothetical protein